MPSFSKFALAAAFAAGASAAPAMRGFSVEQVPNPSFQGPNAIGQLVKVHEKYGAHERAKVIRAHAGAAAATSTSSSSGPAPTGGNGSSGSVTANPSASDAEYLCQVTVGNTQMNLDFDTGSSDLWVFSSELPSNERGSHAVYTPSASNKVQGGSWKITYGDHSGASGDVYHDTVNIGGVSVTSQGVEAATSISAEFIQDTSDGLVGLAFSSINSAKPQQKTFIDNAVAQGLPENVFAADLKYHAAGSYDFGFLDSSKYTGDITYTAVNDGQGFWEFTSSGYAVGSGAVVSSNIDGIADTGTSLIMAPTAVVEAYYKQVQGAKNAANVGYTFPCSATLPNFTLEVGGYKAVVPGKYINYSPESAGSSTCVGGIQDNSAVGITIWGDVFLKSQYVVFDRTTGSPRLGLAAQAS